MHNLLLKEMTLSVMTLRNASLFERMKAAASAGFGGIGIRLSDYDDAKYSGISDNEINERLTSYDLYIGEVEFLRDWVRNRQDAFHLQQQSNLFKMAKRFGSRRVNIAVFDYETIDVISLAFADICKRAADYDLLVQLEYMPYTPPVNTLTNALKILDMAAQPNGRLLIDAWHFSRTPGSAEAIAAIPPNLITGIQIADISLEPMVDLIKESRHHRHVPGEGVMDMKKFIHMLDLYGICAPFSVEVMSDDLDAIDSVEAAQRVARGILKTFMPAIKPVTISEPA